MGTAAFAAPCLQILREQGHEVRAVVTQPDRPAGRGQATHAAPVKALALELGFSSHAHFSFAFQRNLRASPSQIRLSSARLAKLSRNTKAACALLS